MTPSTHLQQEAECNLLKSGLPAKDRQTNSSANAPVLSDTIGCPPKQQPPQSLLSVEEEIVQILAEMQMKRSVNGFGVNDEDKQVKTVNNKQTECNGCGVTEDKTQGNQKATVAHNHLQHNVTAPVEVHTNNDITESNLDENIIPNHLEHKDNEAMISDASRGDTGDKLEVIVTSNDLRDNDSSHSGNIGSAGRLRNISAAGCSGNISAADSGTPETIKAVETTDRAKHEALSASQIHVQLALKLIMKEEGSSLLLLSPPVMDESNRNLLSLQEGKSVLPQDVQIKESRMESGGNSQVYVNKSLEQEKCTVKQEQEDGFKGVLEENYPSKPTFGDILNNSVKENSDEIEVVYERRKHITVPLAVKHEKSTVQQVEAGYFSMDKKDTGPTHTVVKCETRVVQQEATDHFSMDNKNMECLNTVQWEKPIKKEEETNFNMDTHVSVSDFPPDGNSATHNNIVDTEKSNQSDDEYDCPMCALAASQAWDHNQERAAILNVITQKLMTGCPTVVSTSNRDTAENERVTASLDNVKEEQPVVSVANCDGYDVKEETKDYTTISDDVELESPVLDCGVSDVPLKKEDSIDTEEHDLTSDNASEISNYKSDIDIVKEEIYFSDQDEDATGFSYAWFGWEQQDSEADMNGDTADWETDCPSNICISDGKTEGDLQETVILSEGMEYDLQVAHEKCSPITAEDKSVESGLEVSHQECSPITTEDKSVESGLEVSRQECSPITTEDRSVKSNLQVAHQECSLVSTEDKSVEVNLHVVHKESSHVSTEDKSVEAYLHLEQQKRSLVSTEDKSVEADLYLEHKERSLVSTKNKSVEADLRLEPHGRLLVSTEDKSVECAVLSRIVESLPVSKEDKSFESGHSSGKLKRPVVSTGNSCVLSHCFPDWWNPNRILVVKLRRIEMADYYKGIGSPLQDRKSTNIRKRKRKDKTQTASCIEASSEVSTHHIPGYASENHRHISSETLENTTINSNQEHNLPSKNHEEIQQDVSNYECNSCSDVFSSKYSLIKHVFTHIGLDAPMHICKYCGKVFNAALDLQRHNKSSCYRFVHKEPSHFRHQAQKSKCKDGINNYVAKNESIDCKFSCSSCEQVFISKYCLIRHVFNHIDGVQPPPHICKLCGKVLSASFTLRRHYKYGCRKSYSKQLSTNGNELQEAIHFDDKNLNVDDMDKQQAAKLQYALNTNNQDVHDNLNGKEKYSYQCSVCGGTFSTASRLKKHFLKICNRIQDSLQQNSLQGMTEEETINDGSAKCKKIVRKTTNREFKCNTCKKVFNTEFHLEMHLSRKVKCTALEQKDSVIDLYDKVKYLPEIEDLSQLKADIFANSKPPLDLKISNIRVTYRISVRTGCREKVFLCDFCDKPFKKSSYLLVHRHTHTGEKYCICSICGKAFGMMGNLRRHLMSHSGEYPFRCNICNRPFKQKEHLKRHRRIHTGETPHKCNICGKGFKQSGSLQKHKVVHTGERPYQCDVCGRTFGLLGNLKQHLDTHSAERCFKCEVCHKSFSRASTLKKHSCISPGDGRRLKCNFCCKYFRTYALLKQHIASHLGIRRYKCNICSKTFVGSGNLKIHMYIHTGEKPYVCEVCGKSFNQSSSMRRHSRVHKIT